MLQRLWQSFIESLPVLGIGLGVVFVGLVALIGIICLMSFFVRLFSGEKRLVSRKKHYDVMPEHTRPVSVAPAFTPVPTAGKRSPPFQPRSPNTSGRMLPLSGSIR